MKYENLLITKEKRIATVTLNRPEKGNTLSVRLMEEIIRMADEFQSDIDTRVVIITGAGKNFSLGVDMKDPAHMAMAGGPILARRRQFNIGPRMIRKLFEIDQITIAAINGLALGGGACIASALDFRISAETCRVAYPEVNLGIPLSWTSLPLCVRLVGATRAKRWVALGRQENASTLLDWGFIDEVVPDSDLLETAFQMAESYAAQAPIPTQMIKRSINAITSFADQAMMHMDGDQVLLAQSSEDFKEGIEAVFSKRPPRFKGK